MEFAREKGYKITETHAYLELGHAYRLNHQIQPAMQNYEKTLITARARGYHLEETIAIQWLGYAYFHKNQNQLAIQHLDVTTGWS